MTPLREAAQQALEALNSDNPDIQLRAATALRAAMAQPELQNECGETCERARLCVACAQALAQPTLQTCNCRWDGEVQVQQCTLHEAHVDAIHEWAERAKTAEKRLAALAQPAPEPVAYRFQSAVGGWAYGSQPPLGSKYPVHPLYTAPPQGKPLSLTDFQEALVYTNLIDRDAIDNPEEYDDGLTLAQVDELHRIIERAHGIGEQP